MLISYQEIKTWLKALEELTSYTSNIWFHVNNTLHSIISRNIWYDQVGHLETIMTHQFIVESHRHKI